jgi:hypothetical protein
MVKMHSGRDGFDIAADEDEKMDKTPWKKMMKHDNQLLPCSFSTASIREREVM